jgi:hypothetical protein
VGFGEGRRAGVTGEAHDRPRTLVGTWLLATAMGESFDNRQKLVKRLNHGRPGINRDEPAVVAATCQELLKRWFGGTWHDQQIADFVTMIRSRLSPERAPDQAQTEAVVRAALTGTSPPHDMTVGDRFLVESLLFAVASDLLQLSSRDAAGVICHAERMAVAAGFDPPLLSPVERDR